MTHVERTLLALAMAGTMTLVGCGTDEHGSHLLSDKDDRGSALVVVMGGRNSCKTGDTGFGPDAMRMAATFAELKGTVDADNGPELRRMFTCFSSSANSIYWTTDEGDTINNAGDLEEFVAVADAFAMQVDAPVHIIGHSYGGWLAAVTARDFKPKAGLMSLTTLDPISRPLCTFSNPANCQSFPRDISVEERQLIADQSDHWGNYYQRDTWYLRSSAAEEADVNVQLDTSHMGVERNEEPWGELVNRIFGR